MDKKDLQILTLLQQDASLSLADLAEAANLAPTPCWRRIQKLKKDGIIRKQVVLCDPQGLNLALTAFVTLRTDQHNEEWMNRFIAGTRDISEIVEIYRIAGDVDYLLKIFVPDIAAYDRVYKRLLKTVSLADVTAIFVMERIKCTTELPLDYA